MLSDYLHRGGRLVLTSQDLLEHRGNSQFVREDLGVFRYTYHTTPTQVIALPDSPLGEMGLWNLNYPYQNWSDHMIPHPSASPLLLDQKLGVVGIAHEKGDFRTNFFSFPLETLDETAREVLIGRSLLWVSPLGESSLELPPTSAEGATIPITLTVGSATTRTLSSVQATLPLPAEMTIVNGSVSGGWVYRPSSHSLFWTGTLAPQEKIVLQADATLASPIADGTHLRLRASLDAGDQLVLSSDAEIWIDVPWLVMQTQVNPSAVWPGQPVEYQVLLRNSGQLTASVRLTGTLPLPLTLITQTLEASSGDVLAQWGRLEWHGMIPPNDSLLITYRGTPGFWNPFSAIVTWFEVDAPYQRLGRGIALYIAGQRYFPIIRLP